MILRYGLCLLFACLAAAVKAQSLPALIPYTDGKLWGYSDSNGIMKIAPQWDEANFFEHDRAVVKTTLPKGGKAQPALALIDAKGGYIISPDKGWTGYFPDWTPIEYIATDEPDWSNNRPRMPVLNMRDTSGRWGLIDAAGMLVIPCEYDEQYGVRPPEFYYNRYLKRFMLLGIKHRKYGLTDNTGRTFIPAVYDALYPLDSLFTATAGKRTTIIDCYNRRILLKSYNQLIAYTGFALVTLNGKTGAVAYPSGKGIVPILYDAISPMYSDDRNYDRSKTLFNITQNGNSGIIRLPSGDTILPLIYSYISRINDSLFIVRKNGMAGIVDQHNHYVVRPKYTYISLEGSGSLFVVKRDRYRLWYISNMRPFTKWRKYEGNKTDMEYGLMNYPRASRDYRIVPKIRINGKDTNRFIKDGIEWLVTAKLAGGNYAIEGTYSQPQVPGVNSITLAPGRYLAIVDTGLQYIARPYRYSLARLETIAGYNPYDRLITLKKFGQYGRSGDSRGADSFSVVTTDFQPVFPLQPFPIHKAFRWNGHVYALVFTYKSSMETGYGTSHGGMSYRTDYTGAKTRLSRDDSGFVPAQEPYNINQITDRYGVVSATFQGYFFAKDSAGNGGIVDIAGNVQFPDISFHFRDLSAIANGLFLLPGERIADSTGRPLFSTVVAVQSVAKANYWHNNYYRRNTELPDPVFRVAYITPKQSGYFYMDSKGRAYIATEILSP